MPTQGIEALSRLRIPDAYRLIMTTTSKQASSGTNSNTPYPTCVSIQDTEALSRLRIPDAYRLIITTADKDVTMQTKSNAPYPVRMSF